MSSPDHYISPEIAEWQIKIENWKKVLKRRWQLLLTWNESTFFIYEKGHLFPPILPIYVEDSFTVENHACFSLVRLKQGYLCLNPQIFFSRLWKGSSQLCFKKALNCALNQDAFCFLLSPSKKAENSYDLDLISHEKSEHPLLICYDWVVMFDDFFVYLGFEMYLYILPIYL